QGDHWIDSTNDFLWPVRTFGGGNTVGRCAFHHLLVAFVTDAFEARQDLLLFCLFIQLFTKDRMNEYSHLRQDVGDKAFRLLRRAAGWMIFVASDIREKEFLNLRNI